MYQLVLLFIFIVIAYYIFQNFRGWNGKLIELPAYNQSLIRQKFREHNGIIIRNFMTEEAKQEYDEIFEYLQQEDEKQEKDIILNNTTLTQIDECVQNIPLLFSSEYLFPQKKEYMRILNTKQNSTLRKNSYIASVLFSLLLYTLRVEIIKRK